MDERERIRILLETREAKRRSEALEALRNIQPGYGGWTWDSDGTNVKGRCKKCKRLFPAIGLVPVPEHVLFGNVIEAGWFCGECRPRAFGRINGEPTLGWPCESPDGPVEKLSRMLRPMEQLGQAMSREIKHRQRKPKAMKPLG